MVEGSAPASSANLGAGFDTLALALDLRCSVTAEPSGSWQVDHIGEHRPSAGGRDIVLEAARRAVGPDRPLHLTVRSEIPIARGLGSSAAAAAAGALAAGRTTGEEPAVGRVFEIVGELEGHPDNAAAATYGGLQAVAVDGRAYRLELHPDLRPVVAVPHAVLSTGDARAALPDAFSRAVAVRTLQRAISLVEGLRTADRALLERAGGDEIHEAPRLKLNPTASRLIDAARQAGAPYACWSGAGPSVLALVDRDRVENVVDAMAGILEGTVLTPDIAHVGLL